IFQATVCEAFYDDYDLYMDNGLQSIKVLTFMSTSKDFTRYCSRYRQTVVGCNHCVCVAGQLYLCTGAICPKSPSNKQLLRAQHLKCRDGDTRMDKDGCNRCICIQNTEYCTGQPCIPPLNRKCPTGAIKEGVCGTCMCIRGKWICHYCKDESEESRLFLTKTDKNDPDQNCKPGTIKENKCGKCFCLKSRWICGNCAEKKNKKKRYKIKKRQMKLSQPKNPECYGKRGEWFIDDDGCNSCTCINNKKLCTRLLCLRSQKGKSVH
ncbi:hypothetical protein HF086_011917, partial [Spodoptera exigua]